MEPQSASHLILEEPLNHILPYFEKVNPLRLLNRGFTQRLESFKEWKTKQRQVLILGASSTSGIASSSSDAQVIEMYIAARDLILNARVNKKNLPDLLGQEEYKCAA